MTRLPVSSAPIECTGRGGEYVAVAADMGPRGVEWEGFVANRPDRTAVEGGPARAIVMRWLTDGLRGGVAAAGGGVPQAPVAHLGHVVDARLCRPRDLLPAADHVRHVVRA